MVVGSASGNLHLYAAEPLRQWTIATTDFPIGAPVTALDITYDGHWVLATTDNFIVVAPTQFRVRTVLKAKACEPGTSRSTQSTCLAAACCTCKLMLLQAGAFQGFQSCCWHRAILFACLPLLQCQPNHIPLPLAAHHATGKHNATSYSDLLPILHRCNRRRHAGGAMALSILFRCTWRPQPCGWSWEPMMRSLCMGPPMIMCGHSGRPNLIGSQIPVPRSEGWL